MKSSVKWGGSRAIPGAGWGIKGLVLLLCLCWSGLSYGAGSEKVITIPLGGVKEVDTGVKLIRISAGDTELIEISPVGTQNVLIKGKQIGSTTLMVWGRSGEQLRFSVQVGVDLESMAFSLLELFPEEKVTLQGTGETLVLRGRASSMEAMNSIDQWVKGVVNSLGPAGQRLRVINLVELPGNQQVQLDVRFAEVSRTALRKMGMNVLAQVDGQPLGLMSAVSESVDMPGVGGDMPSVLPTPMSESIRVLFNGQFGANFPFNAVLSVLSRRSMARTLSEPTLVALSGQKANFLVGGEFPVPIPLGMGQVSIEYKKFGVQLEFTPTVLRDHTIQMNVASTVSDLDYSRSVKQNSIEIPSLSTRHSQTTVRMKSGQSFAVAGLLSDKVSGSVDKVPLLGDIPIIGMLFRSKQFQREETELIVVVSANLVEPLDPSTPIVVPGENYLLEPTSLELFLLGWVDIQRPDNKDEEENQQNRNYQNQNQYNNTNRPAGRMGYR